MKLAWVLFATAIAFSQMFPFPGGRGPTAAPPSFSPSDLSGLKIWYKADSESYSDADPVGTMTDRSGLGNNATATGTDRPTYKTNILNGKAVYRFSNAAGNYTTTPAVTSGSVFLVANFTGGSTFPTYSNLVAQFTNPSWGQYGWIGTGGATVQFTGANYFDSSYLNNTLTADFAPLSSFKVVALLRSTTLHVAAWGIGWDVVNAGRQWDGDIVEVIVYDTALGTTDRQSVQTYLGSKYAITIAP